MNTRYIARALGATLLLAAVTGSALPATAASHAPATRSSAPFDRQFIDMMVPHHQGAVEMARIALVRGQHPTLKTLARAVILAQEKEIARLKLWRKAWYGSARTPSMTTMPMLPGMAMNMSMMDMSKQIQQLRTAKPFDKAFIDAMIPHHQSAVAAAQLELQRGSNQQLKKLARSIIADQQREIRQMKSWRMAWYGGAGMGQMGH